MLAQAQRLLGERRVAEALAAFQQAASAGADPDSCDAGLWECAMLRGQWGNAWAASDRIEARRQASGIADEQRFWNGDPLTGKRVMLRCLHGFGDALQFIRYVPRLRRQAASVCVEAHPEVVSLLRACDGVEQIVTWSPPPPRAPEWDAQVEAMELAWIFRATPATAPATFPYLHASRLTPNPATVSLVERMRDCRSRGRMQYGVSWRSSNWNPLRTVPLPELARALASTGNCDGYSLQQDGSAELADVAALHLENIEAPFAELAVRIASLDVVITVDGVLAHLAGALGKPVLLLLPFAADWRWGLAATTPWYPRARLFRQRTPGDWSVPIEEAAEALRHPTQEL